MAGDDRKSASKIGFGSGDYKGRGALFVAGSRNRHQHANRMEDEFYCHEDHALDDFERRHGRPDALSLTSKQRRAPADDDDRDFLYDRVLGPKSQTSPCFLCKFDQYTCRHRRPKPAPKESVTWPTIASHDWGWYVRAAVLPTPVLTEWAQVRRH